MHDCVDQLALIEMAVRAARLKIQVELEYDSAVSRHDSSVPALEAAFGLAGSRKSEAEAALRKHLQEHRCTPLIQVA